MQKEKKNRKIVPIREIIRNAPTPALQRPNTIYATISGGIMENTQKRFRCLSGSTLKIIAICAMAIDHFAASIIYYGILLPRKTPRLTIPNWDWFTIYMVMRCIGRIAFPIFCFLLIEGFLHTSNKQKYALRLFLFALISEFPFDLALFNTPFDLEHQNVFFTLLIGLLVIWAMEAAEKFRFYILLKAAAVLAGGALALLLKTDYDYKGIIVIVVLYCLRYNQVLRTIVGCICLLWEAPACFAFIPINLYNGKRGLSLKYFFYAFYPVHLLIYAAILHFVI